MVVLQWVLDILFVLAAVIFIIVGVKRGFVKSVVQTLKVLLAILLAFLLGGLLGNVFKDAFIYDAVEEPVHEWVESIYEEGAESVDIDDFVKELPDFIVTDDFKESLESAMAEGSADEVIDTVTEKIVDPVATAIANVLGYAAVFFLALIALSVVAWLLTAIINRIAVLGTVNSILGGVMGAVTAAVVLLFVASVLKALCGTADFYQNSVIVKLLGESSLLENLGLLG